MKINDKSLSSFARSRPCINKEGFLLKKGELNHSYKSRWFVLKGNLLFYFEKQNDKQPLGMIILENCGVEVSDTDRFSFCIRYQASGTIGASRTYILCAADENEMEQWIKVLTSASYSYTAMIVSEFEKMLEQLKSEKGDTAHESNVNNGESQNTLLNLATGDVAKVTAPTAMQNHSNNFTMLIDTTDSVKPVKPKRTKTTGSKQVHKMKTYDMDYVVNTKNKPVYDMYTVTTTSNAKTKFKTLNTIRRSKSSENINRITSKDSSPNPKRKSRMQTVKRPQTYAPVSQSDNIPNVAYEFEKTTFEILHTSFGAAIWTRIGETL